MDSVHNFPGRRVIKEEAVAWLIRLDSETPLSKSEHADLQEWLARSPAHRSAINELNSFWSNNVLTELMVPLGTRDSAAGLWTLLANRYLPGFGAVLATFFAFGLLLSIVFLSPNAAVETNGLYLTAVGQQQKVELADGSIIELNTNSQIEVDYTDQYRNLRLLQGEVHFDVTEDKDKPFRVYAGSGRVQAVGTAFSVHLVNDGLSVLVTEGQVALASLGGSLVNAENAVVTEVDPFVHSEPRELGVLDAGHSVIIDLVGRPLLAQQEVSAEIQQIEAEEVSRRQSWREGMLVFSGEPLEQVVDEISRYTTVSIEIDDPELRELQIGGRFRVGEVANMFAALEANFGIQVERVNYNQITLKASQ